MNMPLTADRSRRISGVQGQSGLRKQVQDSQDSVTQRNPVSNSQGRKEGGREGGKEGRSKLIPGSFFFLLNDLLSCRFNPYLDSLSLGLGNIIEPKPETKPLYMY